MVIHYAGIERIYNPLGLPCISGISSLKMTLGVEIYR